MKGRVQNPEVLDFEIPVVGEALGHSLIYEEYKGDLALARSAAEAAVAATPAETPEGADARIALGLVYTMQGEVIRAQKHLEEVEHIAAAGAAQKYFAFACRNMATMYQYRLGPSGGLFTLELGQMWDGIEYAGHQQERLAALRTAEMSPSSEMQAGIVYDVLSMMPVQRQIAEGSGSFPPGQLTNIVGSLLSGALQFQQAEENSNTRPRILAFIDKYVADIVRRAGMTNEAQGPLAKAFQRYQSDGDTAGAAGCQMLWGDWNAAPSSSPLIWNLLGKESTSESGNLTWVEEAREFRFETADLKQSIEAYAIAHEGYTLAAAPRGLAALKLRQAYLTVLQEDYRTAAGLFEESAAMAERAGDGLLSNLARLSAALARVGVSHRGEDHSTMKQIGEWGVSSGSIAYACGLGVFAGRVARHWLLRTGDYERASASYRMTRTLFHSLGVPLNESQSVFDIASLHAALGDRYPAIAAFEEALSTQQTGLARYPSLEAHIRRCSLEIDLRLYRLYESAVDPDGIGRIVERLERQFGSTPPDGPALLSIAGLSETLLSGANTGDDSEALDATMDFAVKQLAYSTLEMARVTAAAYRASRARAEGDRDLAESEFQKAEGFARSARLTSPDFLEAVVAGQRRDYVAAATAFRRYLGRGGANFGFVGQYVEHLAAHSSTGSQEQRIQHERTLEQAATFMLRSKQYAEAKQHFESLEKLAGPDWWRRNTDAWETASDYGETYEGLNDFHTALTWYDRGIQLLERNRLFLSREELKIALASQRGARYLYFNAARAALRFKHQAEAAGDHESAKLYAARAFGYGESGRARALLDLLATDAAASPALDNARRLHARITTWRSLLGQMIEREQANTQAGADRSAVADLQNRIARDEQALAEYESQLAGSAEAAPLDKRGEVLSMADVTRMLQPGTCLLQYYFMSDDLLIWVIDGNGMLFSLLATQSAAELTVAIEKFRGECESQLPGRRRAAELARILIEPLKEVLPQYQRIVIVPHGAAHHLPFHLLPLNGEPFGLQFDITYLPSASVLRYIPGDWPGLGSTILAVGNPTGMAFATGEGHEATPANSLPGTTIEARAIALMFPHSLLLLGDEASKGNVLRDIERCGVLHFATHGRLDGTQPALSGLLLANGEMLNVYELSGLHLKANLVTLSACDTGRGQSTGGDDVLGLSRAFFSAGAQYLVVSLWPVDDATAMVFMLHFYRILRAGSAPAEAMRMAQAELRSLSLDQFTRERDELLEGAESSGGTPTNWGTPYYWGPFVVIGKP